jgi:hypothetical protein
VYVEQGGGLSSSQVAALVALSRGVDLRPGPGGARITPVNLDDVSGALPATLPPRHQAQFVLLLPSAQLVGHIDPPVPNQRFHIPLIVNDGCWVFSAGTWQQLEVGKIYQMDPTQVHGAVNWGAETRVHLILDTV